MSNSLSVADDSSGSSSTAPSHREPNRPQAETARGGSVCGILGMEVKAGLTGWRQINGRSDVSLEEALRMDLFCIKNWSLSPDLYILAKTAGAVQVKGGAY